MRPTRPFKLSHLLLRLTMDVTTIGLILVGGVSIYKSGFFWSDSHKSSRRRLKGAADGEDGRNG